MNKAPDTIGHFIQETNLIDESLQIYALRMADKTGVFDTFYDTLKGLIDHGRDILTDKVLKTAIRLQFNSISILAKKEVLNESLIKFALNEINNSKISENELYSITRSIGYYPYDSRIFHSKNAYDSMLTAAKFDFELTPTIEKKLVELVPSSVLKFRDPSPESIILAIKKTPWIFEWINQTDELIDKALDTVGTDIIEFINNIKPRHIEKALKIDPDVAVSLGKTKNKKVWDLIIKENPENIAHFPGVPPEELMLNAVNSDPEAIRSIPLKSSRRRQGFVTAIDTIPEKVYRTALLQKPELAKHFYTIPPTVISELLKKDKKNSKWIIKLTPKMEKTLLKDDPNHLAYIRKPSINALKEHLPNIDAKFYPNVKFAFNPKILDMEGVSKLQTSFLLKHPDLIPKTLGFLGKETQSILSEGHLDKLYEYYSAYIGENSKLKSGAKSNFIFNDYFSSDMIANALKQGDKKFLLLLIENRVPLRSSIRQIIIKYPEFLQHIGYIYSEDLA